MDDQLADLSEHAFSSLIGEACTLSYTYEKWGSYP